MAGLEPLTNLINEQQLNELYERADDARRNVGLALHHDDKPLALVYATMYQAENLRIANFLKEQQMEIQKNPRG